MVVLLTRSLDRVSPRLHFNNFLVNFMVSSPFGCWLEVMLGKSYMFFLFIYLLRIVIVCINSNIYFFCICNLLLGNTS